MLGQQTNNKSDGKGRDVDFQGQWSLTLCYFIFSDRTADLLNGSSVKTTLTSIMDSSKEERIRSLVISLLS
eukprot:m.245419 g.245419  ORF g.245419 m.245419 type:complete len:71 (-) comp17149_c1_seq43:598-810(-)